MSSSPEQLDPLRRFLDRLSAARFLTISVLIHSIAVLLVGGTVLYRVTAEPPDFEAGGGMLVEQGEQSEPVSLPSLSQQMEQVVTPPQMTAAPLPSLITATNLTPTWTVTAAPQVPVRGLSDSMKGALASMGDKMGAAGGGLGGGGMGRLGGTRTSMIFGKKVTAAKLGVILDVSGSAHPFLAGAVEEIQKGFADATLILYPGCGLMNFDGKSDHEIRKYSAIPKKDFDPKAPNFTTPAQIIKALKIAEFAEMTKKPSVKDTLYVSWHADDAKEGKPEGDSGKLIGRTQVAFEDLFKRGVDTIYWFADFADKVDSKVIDRLSETLKNKKITLHVHNFAGKKINAEVTQMAENTGGTVNTEKPGK